MYTEHNNIQLVLFTLASLLSGSKIIIYTVQATVGYHFLNYGAIQWFS